MERSTTCVKPTLISYATPSPVSTSKIRRGSAVL